MGSLGFFGLLFFSRTNGTSHKWEEISRILTKTRKLSFKTRSKFIAIFSGRNGKGNNSELFTNKAVKWDPIYAGMYCTVYFKNSIVRFRGIHRVENLLNMSGDMC